MLTTPAYAGRGQQFVLGLAGTQVEDSVEQGQPKNTKTLDRVTIYDVSLAYQFELGILVGLRYWNLEQNSHVSDDTGIVTSGSGPTLGYFHESGLLVTASYLFAPSKDFDPVGTYSDASYYGGYGTLLGIGYVKMLDNYGLGVTVGQSDMIYKKTKGGDGLERELSGRWKDHTMYPYLQLLVHI